MKKRTRKLLAATIASLVLVLMLSPGLSSTYALADDGTIDDESAGGTKATETTYDLWLGGTQVTDSNKGDICSDGKASYNPATHTLILNNPSIQGTYNNCGIYASGIDLTIKGSVTLDGASASITTGIEIEGGSLTLDAGIIDITGLSKAIHARDTITIKGGKVTAQATQSGSISISSTSKAVIIEGGEVTASGSAYGIQWHTDLTIEDGSVTAVGGNDGFYSLSGNALIENGTVTAKGVNGGARDRNGIYAPNGTVQISGGQVTAIGDSQGIQVGAASISGGTVVARGENYGITAGEVTISGTGTKVDATATSTGISSTSSGIRATRNAVAITDGEVTASGGLCGIEAAGDITITDADVEASGKFGAKAGGDLSIAYSTVTATGLSDDTTQLTVSASTSEDLMQACGLDAGGDLSISDALVIASGTNSSKLYMNASGYDWRADGHGIRADGAVTIANSIVTATGTDNGTVSDWRGTLTRCGIGIQAGGAVTIANSTVTATGTDSATVIGWRNTTKQAAGLQAGGAVTIENDSDVTVEGLVEGEHTVGDYGLLLTAGDLTIRQSTLDATSHDKNAVLAQSGSIVLVRPCHIALPEDSGFSQGDSTVYEADGSISKHVVVSDEPIIYTVTYKVANGTWSDGTTADKTEEVEEGQSPASVPSGMRPDQGYEGGAWDTNPAGVAITQNRTFTYSFTEIPAPILYTVTYKVANGTWSDGTTADKTEEVEEGQSPASVPSGMRPDQGYEGGAWDTNPAGVAITQNRTFTYSFTETVPPQPVNTPPTLREGIEPAASFTIETDDFWAVDLDTIFTDADGDDLAYKVRYSSGLTVDIPARFGFSFAEPGIYTLVFTANDGQADSPTYTVTLTVNAPVQPTEKQAIELAGTNRYETMAEIVEEAFGETGSDYVIVASGENFPDALAAASLAGLLDCPVVLTTSKALNDQAATTIRDLGATKAVIVGGTGAVSDATARSVKALVGSTPVRLSGSSRYDTMLAIYEHAGIQTQDWGDTAIIATGKGYADTLSISGWAFASKSPIFLCDPGTGLTDATKTALTDGGFTRIVIVGGTGVVPGSVDTWATNTLGITPERLGGANRYDTSKKIAEFALENGGTADHAAIATGKNFPDALAGGALVGRNNSILLLADPGSLTALDVLAANKDSINTIYYLGGIGAVPLVVRTAAQNAIGMED